MRSGLALSEGNADASTYLYSSGKLQRAAGPVTDAGGTNFRTAVMGFDGKKAVIESCRQAPHARSDEPAEWNEFISCVADRVQPLMGQTADIGFCFSYPIEITPGVRR